MDEEPLQLQHFGAVEIVVESFKILRSCFKLLGLITLTLVLPFSFVILAHGLLIQPLLHKIAKHEFFLHAEAISGSPVADRKLHQIYVEWGEVLLIEVSYVAFSLTLSLLCTSAVAHTVACLYTGKELCYATVISVMPRIWRRLRIIFLWFFALVSAYYIFVAVVVVMSLSVLIGGVHNNGSFGVFWFGVVVLAIFMGMGLFCVHVYMSMMWQLAIVVCIVEDEYGMGAMKKSRDLIKGKRGAALALTVIYVVAVVIIWQLFEFSSVNAGRQDIEVWERTANGVLLVVLLCAVNVMWLLTQTVVYFVCKCYHHQSIDKLAVCDNLEGYLDDYTLLKDAINAIEMSM